MRSSLGGYVVRLYSEFQNLSSHVLRGKPCHCRYLTIVFVLFSVTLTVSTHLCVICCHFCCPMLPLQGHVTSRSFTLTGPHTLLYHILCKVWKIVSPSQCLLGPSWAVHTEPEVGHMAHPMAYSTVHPKFCIFSEYTRKILRLFSGNQYQ